jgi:hypothetical protein
MTGCGLNIQGSIPDNERISIFTATPRQVLIPLILLSKDQLVDAV